MARPKAKVVKEVCTLCGLDWKLHGTEPTAETCVKLLLDEVRSLNAQLSHRPFVIPRAYPVPYPVYPRPYWPHWYGAGEIVRAGSNSAMPAGPQRLSLTSGAPTS